LRAKGRIGSRAGDAVFASAVYWPPPGIARDVVDDLATRGTRPLSGLIWRLPSTVLRVTIPALSLFLLAVFTHWVGGSIVLYSKRA
jgi:hypothetical protein